METTVHRAGAALFTERRLASISVMEGSLPAGFMTPRHAHAGHHFLFVASGCVEDHGLARAERYEPGQVRESPDMDRHLLRAPVAARVVLVSLHHRDDVEWPRSPASRRTHPPGSFDAQALLRALEDDDPCPRELEEHALSLLGRPRIEECAAPWLRRVRDRLHAGWRDASTLASLCAEAGVSREHVTRSFRAAYGCTMSEYARRLQVEYVRSRLAGDTPLALLAREAGFADQSHMTRVVQQALGAPPGRLREALRRRGKVSEITFVQESRDPASQRAASPTGVRA
ncbi:MAG: AraC family transcriptional regulator [Gemmatimonadetes bacterium]|nr:AraC family transcriptional regulator [Gemmatimonadota bacterium]